jgi:hypothetical protein
MTALARQRKDLRAKDDALIRQADRLPVEIHGYTEMVTDRIRDGWSSSLLTFLFPHLPRSRPAVIDGMKDEIQRFYSTLVTSTHRKSRTAKPDEFPLLIAVADLPVYKRDKTSSPMVLCNGGLNFHGLLLVPPTSRLKEPVDQHIQSRRDLYLRGRSEAQCRRRHRKGREAARQHAGHLPKELRSSGDPERLHVRRTLQDARGEDRREVQAAVCKADFGRHHGSRLPPQKTQGTEAGSIGYAAGDQPARLEIAPDGRRGRGARDQAPQDAIVGR